MVIQRELGSHTHTFSAALRASLREDPDVILVGEMRDLETIELALTAAETGHLVFSTLHTSSASQTIDRVIDVFPDGKQAQIRTMLADTLKGVICQKLLKRRLSYTGRIAALEVLFVNAGVSNLIRESKTYQLATVMQTMKEDGMQVMDDVILRYLLKSMIHPEEAYLKANNKKLFQEHIDDIESEEICSNN